ncbi:MCE family protein [Rhodococcus sp. B7740]|uniref:MCE family protein n=1 Tax=Rhodococcus sp. B7740 TaxID=1564114 RepID=UPI0005EB06D2|nr:MCE family protein [Rhodococcus sp. B7740]
MITYPRRPSWHQREGGRIVIGLLTVIVLGAAYSGFIARGGSGYGSTAAVTVVVPASAGALDPGSSVRYRGVQIGTVEGIDAEPAAATVTLALDPALMDTVPADVRVRLVPSTVFGSVIVEFVPSDRHTTEHLTAGAVLPHDDSSENAQLYGALDRIDDTLSAVDPGAVNATLDTLAQTLRGRGHQIGDTLEGVSELIGSIPTESGLGATIDDAANANAALAALALDAVDIVRNTAIVGSTLSEQRQSVIRLLAGAAITSDTLGALFDDNRDRIITVVDNASATLGVVDNRPARLTAFFGGIEALSIGLPPVLESGYFAIDAGITVQSPFPYSGTVGPVGSDQESQVLGALFGVPGGAADLLAGPILRGTSVTVR